MKKRDKAITTFLVERLNEDLFDYAISVSYYKDFEIFCPEYDHVIQFWVSYPFLCSRDSHIIAAKVYYTRDIGKLIEEIKSTIMEKYWEGLSKY